MLVVRRSLHVSPRESLAELGCRECHLLLDTQLTGMQEDHALAMELGFVVSTMPSAPLALPHNKQRPIPTIYVYPTVQPETIVIPIVSCIFGFPLLALLVICCLRRRAKLARERDRRRAGNCESDPGAISLVRFSPMHRLGVYLAGPTASRNRAVSLRSERALSRAFPSAELDTVVEERSDPDPESTAVEVLSPDS